MEIFDWIAILGALAWMPHLISTIKQWITKSKIQVITPRNAEIGFTSDGPTFNIPLAFAVKHRDIVVSGLKIRLKHESGEEKIFDWQSITQQIGTMTAPDANVMPFEKEQSVLAIKINEKEIEERFIQCRETSFIASKQEYVSKAIKKMAYLKAEGKYDPQAFLREQEMTELYSFNKQEFIWKQGKYVVTIEIQSPEKFEIVDNKREFMLSHLDIEELEKNKDLIEQSYQQIVLGPPDRDKEVVWQWRYPLLEKK